MIKKIFHSTLLANLLVLLTTLILIIGALYRYFTDIQLEQLQTQTALAAQGVGFEGKDYFDGLKTNNVRITWVDNEGVVLYDTKNDPTTMENHGGRKEIQQALETGYGESRRYSSTLTQTSLYVAQRLNNGTVVRLSVTQESILLLLLGMIYPVVFIVLVAIFISIWVARYTAKRIVLPLNHLNLDAPLENAAYEEISPLLRRIDKQQRELTSQEQLLTEKKNQFDTIISKIKEGMLLLDDQLQIISMNHAAQQLFQVSESPLGKDILEVVRDVQLHELLEQGLKGEKCEGILHVESQHYKVLIRPILAEERVTGLVVLLFDITEQLQTEQLRREFTANVSHELKTPLHIISGYSEMMQSDMVSESDMRQFAGKIYQESKRMVKLVEDVINLSQLDEKPQLDQQEIDLYQLAQESLDSLASKASNKQVSLHLEGQSAPYIGNPSLLSSVIFNLCDNAITYNKEGGEVIVRVEPTDSGITLQVSDTGIGIPKEEEERIFERFYRIDKSRSKKVGGTGLGLSIVKHALKRHQASLTLDSELGKGTTVTVQFPVVENT
ncbi:ATP-binding protein [Streptococcus cameli]